MRFLVRAKFPAERVNQSILDGSFADKMQQTFSELKPEAAYFLEENGNRTAILIVDISEASQIPKVAEPFFQGMNAAVHLHPVMSVEDLAASNLAELAKKWGGI
jgi:hypothetical protein